MRVAEHWKCTSVMIFRLSTTSGTTSCSKPLYSPSVFSLQCRLITKVNAKALQVVLSLEESCPLSCLVCFHMMQGQPHPNYCIM